MINNYEIDEIDDESYLFRRLCDLCLETVVSEHERKYIYREGYKVIRLDAMVLCCNKEECLKKFYGR